MSNRNKIWAIVPAAGSGSRVGGVVPKQYLKLHDKAVITWTIERLLRLVDAVIVAVSEMDEHWPALQISRHEKVRTVRGGAQRCYSVMNAIQALRDVAGDSDWVLVHDAARPCVRCDDVQRLLDASCRSGVGGILATPVRDTMKQANQERQITHTLDRSCMWHALTPQCFRYADLAATLEKALHDGFKVTDEASAMEYAGYRPLLVEGHSDNIKITMPQDVLLAAYFLQQQATAS